MRKLIVLEYITLDGVIQAAGGSQEGTLEGFKYGGWQGPYFDDFLGKVMEGQMKQPFSLLLAGKHTTFSPGIGRTTKISGRVSMRRLSMSPHTTPRSNLTGVTQCFLLVMSLKR